MAGLRAEPFRRPEPENSRPAASESSALDLAHAIGNQALGRILAARPLAAGRLQREEVALGAAKEKGYAADAEQAKAMEADWAAIHAMGFVIDTKATIEKAKARARAGTPGIENLGPERWVYEELRGLREALERFGDLRKSVFQFRGGKMAVVEGDRGWVVGKTNAVLGASLVEGETWPETKQSTIALTGDCDVKNFELEPEPEPTVAEDPGVKRERQVRTARAVWVHEIGHTMWLRFRPDWTKEFPSDAGSEAAPTKYARDRDLPEEDFADSFTLYVLYRDHLKSVAPKRHTFLATHHGALILKEPPPEQKKP
jgi:hypothetical protein